MIWTVHGASDDITSFNNLANEVNISVGFCLSTYELMYILKGVF